MVLIVAIAASVPTLASGQSAHPATSRAIFCPLSNRSGGVIRHLKVVKHHRRHHGRRHSAGPSAPVGSTGCYPIPCPAAYRVRTLGRTGPTGATGPDYVRCRPLPCLFGATGATGTTLFPRPIPACRPIPCAVATPSGSTGVRRPSFVLPCRPIPCAGATGEPTCPPPPCPALGSTAPGTDGPAIVCGPIVCPLSAASSRASAAIVACPGCPPPVSAGTAKTASSALHACPLAHPYGPTPASSRHSSAVARNDVRAG
jgi:hypothetical protein